MIDLKNLTALEMASFFSKIGLPPARAGHVFGWLFRPGNIDIAKMDIVNRGIRKVLQDNAFISHLNAYLIEASGDGTVKFGFQLADGEKIESVLIPGPKRHVSELRVRTHSDALSQNRKRSQGAPDARKRPANYTPVCEQAADTADGVSCDRLQRHTLCISSQVGCAMGCHFCLTGGMGFVRNLEPAEIVGQVLAVIEYMVQTGVVRSTPREFINNLVFMGMGEPLANFDHLLTTLGILMDRKGLEFTERRITVSTCGIVPRIKDLGQSVRINLAISLHAADDTTRNQLMPVNHTYPVGALLKACREYPLAPGKVILIEYILFQGINDSEDAARLLAAQLHGIPCRINLMPFNESDTLPYRCPEPQTIKAFQQILRQAGFTTLIRNSRGADISAACGQLASRSTRQSRKKH